VSPTTAKVYGALLRAIEGNTSRCYDVLERRPEVERDFFGPVYDKPKKKDIGLSEPITTREVANVLDPAIELDDGLAPEPDDDVAPSIEGANGVNGHPENDDGGDIPTDSRLRKIEQHLHLLLCDPRGFVQITHREWRVPFHAITQRIIEGEIENIVTHTLGTLPTRMLRILKYFGHQELRALAAKAMVTEDQARTACQHLQSAGWIEVVELPRTARREVTKSMWLWSYDVLKARQRVLSDCYFTMARLSVRLSHDRQTIEQVINKAERSDVQGNEDKYLTDKEKEAIAKLDKTTHAVVRQMIRMDEIVALMRDFSTMEYPHKIWDMGWVEWHSPSREPTDDEKKTIEEYEARGREDADENEMSGEDDEGADGLLEPE
jgi:DNA-directed RNA polymerase III subunit RPC3